MTSSDGAGWVNEVWRRRKETEESLPVRDEKVRSTEREENWDGKTQGGTGALKGRAGSGGCCVGGEGRRRMKRMKKEELNKLNTKKKERKLKNERNVMAEVEEEDEEEC